jgi:hypothetical protein
VSSHFAGLPLDALKKTGASYDRVGLSQAHTQRPRGLSDHVGSPGSPKTQRGLARIMTVLDFIRFCAQKRSYAPQKKSVLNLR